MEERLKEFYLNNSTGTPKVITLKEETSCGVFETILEFTQTINANTEAKIEFPSDGTYEVYVDSVTIGVAKYYPSLFKSMIAYISAAICAGNDTPCLSNSPCSGEEIDLISNAFSKEMLYIANNTTKYETSLLTALSKTRCSTKEVWPSINITEQLMGISDTKELSKIELAHIYLELYSKDITLENPINLQELKNLYNYDKLRKCISYLGILNATPPALIGLPHTTSVTVTPSSIAFGAPTSITVNYRFIENGDTFVALLDTNIPNATLAKLNGVLQTEVILGVDEETTYYITYSYIRGNETYQKTVSATVAANAPQWFGGESVTADFASTGGKAFVSQILSAITNISPTYKEESNGTSSNTNTLNKYIWWITTKPVNFYISGFNVLSGPWSPTCNPASYAIIVKTLVTVMQDGITEKTMYFYRTCPLQDLTGQTLTYNLIEQ